MRIILLVFMVMLSGCGRDYSKQQPIMDDNLTRIAFSGHIKLCNINPMDMFCKDNISIGDIEPTRAYVISVLNDMNSNFSYKKENVDEWKYNYNIYDHLIGDCEDISMTMIHYMIEDGISREYIALCAELWTSGEWHIFVAVKTVDHGWVHLDYSRSGYKATKTNYYMPMTNAGAYNFIKGDINDY